MLWILLLAVLFTFYRPLDWRDAAIHLGFMATLALMFSAVGNRGLIKNSFRYARFVPPALAPEIQLEVDLRIDRPLMAQLFWDTGRGLNETQSSRRSYEPHTTLQTLRFPLPTDPIKALRFDPLDNEAQIVVRGLRIADGARRTLALLPLSSLKPQHDIAQCIVANDVLTITTRPGVKDPILIFNSEAIAIANRARESQAALTTLTDKRDTPSR